MGQATEVGDSPVPIVRLGAINACVLVSIPPVLPSNGGSTKFSLRPPLDLVPSVRAQAFGSPTNHQLTLLLFLTCVRSIVRRPQRSSRPNSGDPIQDLQQYSSTDVAGHRRPVTFGHAHDRLQ